MSGVDERFWALVAPERLGVNGLGETTVQCETCGRPVPVDRVEFHGRVTCAMYQRAEIVDRLRAAGL